MTMTDNATPLYEAMAAAFAEIEGATKDTTNPHFKAKYADLSSVVSAIKPALAKNGLWFRQVMHERDRGVCVETIVCHKSGQELTFGILFVPAKSNDAQAFGSALTYARRYSLMTAFGVCPEDDDGNKAVAVQHEPEPAPALITDNQREELMALFEALNVPVADFLKAGKVEDLRQLEAGRFESAKTWINKRANEMRKEQEPN